VVRAFTTGAEGLGFKTACAQAILSLFTHQGMGARLSSRRKGEGGEEEEWRPTPVTLSLVQVGLLTATLLHVIG